VHVGADVCRPGQKIIRKWRATDITRRAAQIALKKLKYTSGLKVNKWRRDVRTSSFSANKMSLRLDCVCYTLNVLVKRNSWTVLKTRDTELLLNFGNRHLTRRLTPEDCCFSDIITYVTNRCVRYEDLSALLECDAVNLHKWVY